MININQNVSLCCSQFPCNTACLRKTKLKSVCTAPVVCCSNSLVSSPPRPTADMLCLWIMCILTVLFWTCPPSDASSSAPCLVYTVDDLSRLYPCFELTPGALPSSVHPSLLPEIHPPRIPGECALVTIPVSISPSGHLVNRFLARDMWIMFP